MLKGLIRKSEMGWRMNGKGSSTVRIEKVTTLNHEVFDLSNVVSVMYA